MKKTLCLLIIILMIFSSCSVKKVQEEKPKKGPKVALVLGAGGSKGFAHIGVLKVLEENKIPIDMIVGTSVGSLVGTLYAYGYSPNEIKKMALGLNKEEILDLTFPSNGFVKGDKLVQFVNEKVKNTKIENFKIPIYIIATNLASGEKEIFNKGNAGLSVRASCSIPGIFQPASIDGKYYIDGGVISPIGVREAKSLGADMIIAVDLSTENTSIPETTIQTILKGIDIMYKEISLNLFKYADILIDPKLENIVANEEMILAGEKAASLEISKIKEKLQNF